MSEEEEEPPGGGGPFASGEWEADDRRTCVWVRVERKGDMRGVPPVRVRVVISPGDAMGRMGRETRGIIVRKKGKRGSIRRIMMVVVVLVVDFLSCRVPLDFERKLPVTVVYSTAKGRN